MNRALKHLWSQLCERDLFALVEANVAPLSLSRGIDRDRDALGAKYVAVQLFRSVRAGKYVHEPSDASADHVDLILILACTLVDDACDAVQRERMTPPVDPVGYLDL